MGKGVFIHDLCDRAKCFLCLLAWWRLLISATEAALSRHKCHTARSSPGPIIPSTIYIVDTVGHKQEVVTS